MIREVHTILPTATVREAITLLLDKAVSGVPVVDSSGKPMSVCSQIDLMKFAATGAMDSPLSLLMDKLVKQFLVKPVRRVLVVDDAGKLHGIVSRSTILKAFMDTAD